MTVDSSIVAVYHVITLPTAGTTLAQYCPSYVGSSDAADDHLLFFNRKQHRSKANPRRNSNAKIIRRRPRRGMLDIPPTATSWREHGVRTERNWQATRPGVPKKKRWIHAARWKISTAQLRAAMSLPSAASTNRPRFWRLIAEQVVIDDRTSMFTATERSCESAQAQGS